MRVYLITLAELVSVPVSETAALLDAKSKNERDEVTGRLLPHREGALLECTARVIQRARDHIRFADDNIEDKEARNKHKQRAYSTLSDVRDALFFDWEISESKWPGPAPGIDFAAYIRRSSYAYFHLRDMSQGLPEPVRRRFSTFPSFSNGADFPPDLPADSPIQGMDLTGFWVFYREEIKALKQGYEGMNKDLFSLYVQSEWNQLFR